MNSPLINVLQLIPGLVKLVLPLIIVLAIIKWRRQPRPSACVLVAGVLFLLSLSGNVALLWAVRVKPPQEMISFVLMTDAVIQILYGLGIVSLVYAVFTGRHSPRQDSNIAPKNVSPAKPDPNPYAS